MRKLLESPSEATLRMRRWVAKNPDYLQKQRDYNAKYLSTEEAKQKNRDRANAWASANRERSRAKAAEWYTRNPDKARINGRANTSRRRARMKCAEVLPIDYEAVQRRSNWLCGICDQAIAEGSDFDYDHIIPIAKGGAHSTNNLQMAHPICNRRKSDRMSFELTEDDKAEALARPNIYSRQKRKASKL